MENYDQFALMDSFIDDFDAHLSLALAADTFQLLLEPRFVDTNRGSSTAMVSLRAARNLQLEFSKGTIDPLNIELEANGQVKVLAASNGNGKSTYL